MFGIKLTHPTLKSAGGMTLLIRWNSVVCLTKYSTLLTMAPAIFFTTKFSTLPAIYLPTKVSFFIGHEEKAFLTAQSLWNFDDFRKPKGTKSFIRSSNFSCLKSQLKFGCRSHRMARFKTQFHVYHFHTRYFVFLISLIGVVQP